jgi:CubicO group peptidase (beta-lactamase class C family)
MIDRARRAATARRGASIALFLTILFAAPSSQAAAPVEPTDLDAHVERVRDEFGVVGMAVAVVKDGDLVYARGFGTAEIGADEPVGPDTLFAIGSNTKAFTAAVIGSLVEEGLMGWDDHVTDHLPWFELYDPYVTREITVRDLLSHRSGLGRRGDGNWYATDFSREEVVRRIRYLPPETSFRATAGYQNTMFAAAGLVAEAVTGKSWETLVEERIFAPVGMARSLTRVSELAGATDVAQPHERVDGEIVAVPYREIENVAPAGSILSSVHDMSRWMRMMLAEGSLDDQRVLAPTTVAEVWSPVTVYPLPPSYREMFPMTEFSLYGLGWGLRDYRGHKVATHTGGIDGMLSQVLLVPGENLGIVVLTNTSPAGSPAESAVTFHVLDAYLGAAGEVDWLERYATQYRDQLAAGEEAMRARAAARVAEAPASHEPDAYVGTYEDPMYGTVAVRLEDGALVLQRHTDWVGDLSHWHYDTFLTRWRDRVMGEGMVSFHLAPDGAVAALTLQGMPEARFVRVPADSS